MRLKADLFFRIRRRLKFIGEKAQSVLHWIGRAGFLFWVFGISLILLIVISFVIHHYWNWLGSDGESNSDTLRNIGLIVAALIALPLTLWRSWVVQCQADTAQQSLLNERYQKGAEMLGDGVLSVRLGGIYALNQLAREHPGQYHIQVMQLFCAFVRRPTKEEDGHTKESEGDTKIREDVQAVMEAIASQNDTEVIIENDAEVATVDSRPNSPHVVETQPPAMRRIISSFTLDLKFARLNNIDLSTKQRVSGIKAMESQGRIPILPSTLPTEPKERNLIAANLQGASLVHAKLEDVNLTFASLENTDLTDAIMERVNLTQALLIDADLTRAMFAFTDLAGASLAGANLSDADLRFANGLTQTQLDGASPDSGSPKLCGVDAETCVPLVWRGRHPDANG